MAGRGGSHMKKYGILGIQSSVWESCRSETILGKPEPKDPRMKAPTDWSIWKFESGRVWSHAGLDGDD